jgi:menaquinol-cytochrome c reductase cytochrome b/c subunit
MCSGRGIRRFFTRYDPAMRRLVVVLLLVGLALAAQAGAAVFVTTPTITIPPPPGTSGQVLAEYNAGRIAVVRFGCLACHKLGTEGNRGPGRNLTHIGARLSWRQIDYVILRPRAPMPSFRRAPRAQRQALVTFLSLLR